MEWADGTGIGLALLLGGSRGAETIKSPRTPPGINIEVQHVRFAGAGVAGPVKISVWTGRST